MDRLRRSLRESFRRKKEHVPECSKPHQWQADEAAVRAGTCNFPVKYLGCVEVFESRGMQVCEEALKVLRNSRRRPVRGILYVTGDGLRVVEDETKGLIVDQTIEKVSFCAPDRNHDKGFSYICRDGTTRRWMCHGFLAIKDSGERLSHAVGCAFAACLERKQKRDKECGVTMTFDPTNSTFTRTGSFRQTSLTERMQDPQECKPIPIRTSNIKVEPLKNNEKCKEQVASEIPPPAPPVKQVHNPFAIERPHATPMMLQRQGSFRGFSQLGQSSPFKRQLSLRLNDLPSTLERQRSLSLESSDFSRQNGPGTVSPIQETSPVIDRQDTISAMCQQVSQGLSLLSSTDDPFLRSGQSQKSAPFSNNQMPMTQQQEQAYTQQMYNNSAYLTNGQFSGLQSVYGDPPLPSQQQQPFQPHNKHQNYAAQTYSTATTVGQGYSAPAGQPFASHQLSSTGPSSSLEAPAPAGRKAPPLGQLRSQSLGDAPNPPNVAAANSWTNGTAPVSTALPISGLRDPFDAEWASLATARNQASTNPFQQTSIKAFEVQL